MTIALAMLALAVLMKTLKLPDQHRRLYRTAARVTFVAAVVIVGLGFSGLVTIPLLVALNLLILAPVFWGLKVWIDVFRGEEQSRS